MTSPALKQVAAQPPVARDYSARARSATILLVDDEPEVLRSLHDLLRLEYRVLTCPSGFEAVKVLESDEPIQVVMSDQKMPGMTGVEVLRAARELRPEATRLLITAYADIKTVVDAINQGSVYQYLSKPWDAGELLAVVRQAVGQHELIAERDRLLSELRESNERLVEANRLKSAFIEVASHELNTPVAVVLGLAQLWRMTHAEMATDSERHWMERIQNAGKRLAATVDRMLALFRAEDFNHQLDLKPTPVGPLVEEAVVGIEPFINIRRQVVLLDVEPDIGEIEIDRSKIGDALTNLLINAVKFTPDGGRITLSVTSEGRDAVQFEVKDAGIGIATDVQKYLFEPFFTGFDTRNHSSGEFEFCKRGIGLGLCLVKRFVEMHGGSVSLRSAQGDGSTFAFTLPTRQPTRGVRLIRGGPDAGRTGRP